MKLGEDEKKIAEYFLKTAGDLGNMSVLTTRRLVVVYANAEESYPLSKITAVKFIYNRITWMIVVGAILALIGLPYIGSDAVAGLVMLALGAGLVYLGWKGKTQLSINHMGGNQFYAVRGKDQALQDFIESVNSKLS